MATTIAITDADIPAKKDPVAPVKPDQDVDSVIDLFYTNDGSPPVPGTPSTIPYTKPFKPAQAGSLNIEGLAIGNVTDSGGGIYQVSSPVASTTFTVACVAPTPSTGSTVTILNSVEAKVAGTVDPGGCETKFWFAWGSSKTALNQTSPATPGVLPAGTSALPVDSILENLDSSTVYYFQLVASNSAGTAKGEIESFKSR